MRAAGGLEVACALSVRFFSATTQEGADPRERRGSVRDGDDAGDAAFPKPREGRLLELK